MTGDATTAFVTGADGFIGRALVEVLLAHGHQVLGFTQSLEAAQRVTRRCAASMARTRVLADAQLLDTVTKGATVEHGLQAVVGALHEH
jgi:nucleoside-diphosphate-sugar epimerase